MTLRQWAENGWLEPHVTSPQEIANLLAMVNRDLTDAGSGISPDWRFGIAYNAALKLCAILLYVEGYRAVRTLHHYRTIQALPLILGPEHRSDADYLDACRKKETLWNTTTWGARLKMKRRSWQRMFWSREIRFSTGLSY
ncbi:MAG: hypothetical protein AB1641_08775 [Thermodesulfobacteriota bacterium]